MNRWRPGAASSAARSVETLCRVLSPFVEWEAKLAADTDWAGILRLAGEHRLVAALACAAGPRAGPAAALPAHAALFLEGALRRNRDRNARFRAQAAEAIAALNAAGITPVLLKGVHDLLERPSDETDRRWMSDVDLLVPRERRKEAARAIEELGYERYVEVHDDFYGHHMPALHRAKEPGPIEIHWELAAGLGQQLLPASEVHERATPREAAGLRYALLPDDQRLIYCVMHAQVADRHHYRLELPLRALDDFTQLAHRAAGIDWPAILARFRSQGAEAECGAFFTLAHRFFDWPWPLGGEPQDAWSRHVRRTLGVLRLPAGLARTITLGDELRKGFSVPILARIYPELEAAGPLALRRHHVGTLLRKYRGSYLARLAAKPSGEPRKAEPVRRGRPRVFGSGWYGKAARRTKPVFIHISKNAGTSVGLSGGDGIVVAGHRTAESWVEEHGRGAPLFAVIRNPYDRVLSEYCFRLRRFEAGDANPHLANLDRPFDAWVHSTFRDGEFRTREFFEASGLPFLSANMVDDCLIWFLPQTRWLGLRTGERLVGELLRFERLEQDWHAFAGKHGLERSLVHRNRSKRERDFRPYYTAEAREIVRDYYREDFEALGFEAD